MRNKQPNPKRVIPSYRQSRKNYSYDALTNAYKKCVEEKMPVRQAAKLYNIPRTTLRDRLSGRIHIDTVTSKEPLFTMLEEAKLADHIKTMADYGYGYTRQECVNLASDMAVQLGKRTKDKPLTLKWMRGFLKRWPELRVLKPRGLEYSRAKMTSQQTVSDYFENLQKCMQKHSLMDKPHLIFNLDEKGVTTEHRPPHIVGSSSHCPPAVTSGRGKTVTILGCISASGMSVPPFFVFPGKRMNDSLLEGKSPGADGTVSETGWSNHAIFRQYLMEHFVKFIPRHDNQKVLLILDGHTSHVSVDLCEWAAEQGIIFFYLPPHTSHLLQPLDVSCYGPFERMFNAECHKLMRQTAAVLTRHNVCKIACRVYTKAISPENAQSAFLRTGIHPLNKMAIPAESLLPAQVYQLSDQDASDNDSQATVEGGVCQEMSLFESREAELKRVKREKPSRQPYKTMGKIVASREVTEEVLIAMKEQESTKCKKSQPKKRLETKKKISSIKKIPKQTKEPQPGPSCINLLPESDLSDTDEDDTQALCCVCQKLQPKELADCVSLVFVKWAQCDGKKSNGFPCLHWVHLKYCTPVKVIRRGDTFLCPHCENEQ